MTIYYPDVYSGQAGISFTGALVAMVKATEDNNYVNTDYVNAKNRAASAGSFFCAYHFLHAGNAAVQAQHAFNVVGKGVPLMLDFEPTAGSDPALADAEQFIDAYRRAGGIVHLLYLPAWYWADTLKAPSLSPMISRNMLLVSSDYTTYTDANSGAGWQPYGGMTPTVWQYTDSLSFNGFDVDFNAFRGHYAGKQDAASVAACVAEFRSMVTTGKFPVPPPPPSAWTYGPPVRLRITVGKTTFKATFSAPAMPGGIPAPALYHVFVYDTTGGQPCSVKTIVASYPRAATASPFQGGGLKSGRTYTIHVVAEGPDGTRIRPYTFASAVITVG